MPGVILCAVLSALVPTVASPRGFRSETDPARFTSISLRRGADFHTKEGEQNGYSRRRRHQTKIQLQEPKGELAICTWLCSRFWRSPLLVATLTPATNSRARTALIGDN
jgi:hypothetical protein